MKPYLLATLGGADAVRCGAVRCAAFSPADTSRLATGGEDRSVRLWDTQSGACAAVLGGHEARVNACVFSPDGAYLVSASNDGSLRLWDVGSGVCALVLTGHGDAVNSCDFSPDGALLASCSDDNTCKARSPRIAGRAGRRVAWRAGAQRGARCSGWSLLLPRTRGCASRLSEPNAPDRCGMLSLAASLRRWWATARAWWRAASAPTAAASPPPATTTRSA